eukprot:SAG11_NODE_16345_length_550_cov_0.800443_1_plen_75_part_10
MEGVLRHEIRSGLVRLTMADTWAGGIGSLATRWPTFKHLVLRSHRERRKPLRWCASHVYVGTKVRNGALTKYKPS